MTNNIMIISNRLIIERKNHTEIHTVGKWMPIGKAKKQEIQQNFFILKIMRILKIEPNQLENLEKDKNFHPKKKKLRG